MNRKIFNPIYILMTIGLLFLYIPIIVMILYSFNASNLVNIWGGFSLRWYYELWQDEELISSLITSLKVASMSASLSVLIGGLAGISLARITKFKGRLFFSSMLNAPFMLPEIIVGFSLIILYIFLEQLFNWPINQGALSIILSHATIGTAYVAMLVKNKMHLLDNSLEEAALDLGAKPYKVFFLITLPLILPAVTAGWLLSFTISFEDLVIASFTSGPGYTTLPMLIYSRIRRGLNPEVNVLATLMLIFISAFSFLAYWFINKKDKR